MFTLVSTKFKAELQRRAAQFKQASFISATIVVPPELAWWYYHEFGTAQYAEKGSSNADGYEIKPVNAQYLKFPDHGDASTPFYTKSVWFPGVKPKHTITKLLGEGHAIAELVRGAAMQAILSSNYDFSTVKAYFEESIMPKVKKLIVEGYAEDLPGVREDGKLHDESASSVFDREAQIVIN